MDFIKVNSVFVLPEYFQFTKYKLMKLFYITFISFIINSKYTSKILYYEYIFQKAHI